MKDWATDIEHDLTRIADHYYANQCPYWEFVIAVQEWVRKAEENGKALFGSKEDFLSERQRIRSQIEERVAR